MNGFVYDAGALLAAENNKSQMWAIHRRATARGLMLLVPAGVLAQAWRGGPQANLSRLLESCDVEPLMEEDARRLGVLAEQSGHSDTVDLSVADLALRTGYPVVTSDVHHIRRVAEAAGAVINMHQV